MPRPMPARAWVPNALTVARLALGPVIFWLVLAGTGPSLAVGAILFASCGILDKLDGWLARRLGSVSAFGILWDPIADKVLIHGTMLAAAAGALIPLEFVYFCISRDVIVSGFRAGSGLAVEALAASRWGKWKTRLQFVFVLVALLQPLAADARGVAFQSIYWLLLVLAAAATLFSAVDYGRRYLR